MLKKFFSITYLITLSAFILMPPLVLAEDIEIYVNHQANQTVDENDRHRILIIFDTSGSMATHLAGSNDSKLNIGIAAIKKVIADNPDIDFGLMRFRHSYNGRGGYVAAGIKKNRTHLNNQVDNLSSFGNTPLAETVFESYRYLSGKNLDQAQGVCKQTRDRSIEFGQDTHTSCDNNYTYGPFKDNENFLDVNQYIGDDDWAENPPKNDGGSYDERSKKYYVNYPNTIKYKSPFRSDRHCNNDIDVIIVSDGDPTSDEAAKDLIINLDERITEADQVKNSYLPALAQYMHNNDLYPATQTKDIANIYTIGFGAGLSPEGKKILKRTAELGGGQTFNANDPDALNDALTRILQGIREGNSSFSAPALANNHIDKTQSHNAVYLSLFYPNKGPRWDGNLKKLKMQGESLVDVNQDLALDSEGKMNEEAHTFWSEEVDGANVKKGGANELLDSMTISQLENRKIFTDVGGPSPLTMKRFKKNQAITKAGSVIALKNYMNVDTTTELNELFRWAIGIDKVNNVEVVRPNIMGDPLHSKPIALNYGTKGTRILIGTNAGFIHMFQDHEESNSISESWAFIPYELYPNLAALKSNTSGSKLYGMDNTPAVFFDDKNDDGIVNNSDRVWAFFSMRRGGSSYYALNITNPDQPKLMWTIKKGEPGFEKLGQSWSKPYIGYINVSGFKGDPLLIFGGGYDTNKDSLSPGSDTYGKGVYIVKAENKTLVHSFTAEDLNFAGTHSIPGEISILDSDYDGYIDRLYAADTGGNIWRFDMPTSNPTDPKEPWSSFKLANLDPSGKRKFFYKPIVVRTYFSKVTESKTGNTKTITRKNTPYEAILIGSGNRVFPVSSTTTANYLFMIRDEDTLTHTHKNTDRETILMSDLPHIYSDKFEASLDNEEEFRQIELTFSGFKGWKYPLRAGEKSLAKANVVGGVAYFSTFKPAPDSAANSQCKVTGGNSGLYAFHLHYGTKVYENKMFELGDGIPATPELFFNRDSDNKSEFLLIGVGKQGTGSINAKSITDGSIPKLGSDGKIKLVKDGSVGLKTTRSYIYRQESN